MLLLVLEETEGILERGMATISEKKGRQILFDPGEKEPFLAYLQTFLTI
jgi:hypothetical protein